LRNSLVGIVFLLVTVPLAFAQTSAADRLLKGKLSAAWPLDTVQTDKEGHMLIVMQSRQVSELQYTTMLKVACHHLQALKPSPALADITFLNQFRAHGYVFEQPLKCPDVIKFPAGKPNMVILGNTHLQ
jgi:hypothetical protein